MFRNAMMQNSWNAMVFRSLFWAMVLFCCVAAALADGSFSGNGAKELFFDPSDQAEIVSVDYVPQGACASTEVAKARAGDSERVGEGECDRRDLERVSDGVSNSGLSYWIELVEEEQGVDGATAGRHVTESRVFKSGERIRLHFLSNCNGSISLFQLGSSGKTHRLFPDPSVGLIDDVMQAGVARILPEPEAWFRFDGEPGTERLIVVFESAAAQTHNPVQPPSQSLRSSEMLALASLSQDGSKDLVIERETKVRNEIGTYAVRRTGGPVVLEIVLQHE